ncbi:acyl-coenzyme A synthetase ACSM3, mitochondrial-like isoform X3 [Phalacrocorax aristotelis]|uniref:acyl-coenzyme A synthetase ACSM3, mitochondrial-like isoform X3 n=1 Tax=Phalacrocorax aristotelis TaxID=126867 RepID=UPI003F4C9BA5
MAAECGLNRCYHHRRDNTTDSTRLLASKAECIITADVLAPAVDSIASKCQFLKTNLIVSESSRAKCLNFSDLLELPYIGHLCLQQILDEFGSLRHHVEHVDAA